MEDFEQFVLFRDGQQVVAVRVTNSEDDWPLSLCLKGRQFELIDVEPPTPFLWDDICDQSGRTVGYVFSPISKAVESLGLFGDVENVQRSDGTLEVLLVPCASPVFACVQGFPALIYRNVDDPGDTAVLIWNYSRNELAFPLTDLDTRSER